jgi:hypothetical protein
VSQFDLSSETKAKGRSAGTDGRRGVVDIQRGAITIPPPATNHGQPEPRSVCFTPDGSVVIAYLEHGILQVFSEFQCLRG